MKKIIVALSLIAFVGAGCAKTPTTTPQPQINLNQSGTQTITTQDGSTAQIKVEKITPQEQNATNTNSNDDVPVTDVFLGEPTQKLNMTIGNLFFKPNVIQAKPGDSIQITFTNVSGTHTFNLDETDSHYQIKQGTHVTIIAPQKTGSYKFYCGISGHREKGMEGTLIVK